MRVVICVAVIVVLAAAAQPVWPAATGGFAIRHTIDGRLVAFWQGDGEPTVEQVKVLIFGKRSSSDIKAGPVVDGISLDSLGSVRFDFGSATVTSPETRKLTKICSIFSDPAFRHLELAVTGHGCAIGSAAANYRVSRHRADNAARFLRNCLGNAAAIARVEGLGKDRLLADVPADSPLQRRVELEILR